MKFKRYSFLGVAVLLFALLYSGSPPQQESTLPEIIKSLDREIGNIHFQLRSKFQNGQPDDIEAMRDLLRDAVIFAPDGRAKREPEEIEQFWNGLRESVADVEFFPVKHKLIRYEFTLDGHEYNYIAIVVCRFSYTIQSGEGENQDPDGSYVQVLLHRRQCDWP